MIRMALLFALLLGSLTVVVWRQSQALAVLRELDAVRRERVIAEAQRSALVRRVEKLESRSRVSEAARAQLGMRLPSGDELVILPMRSAAAPILAAGSADESDGGSGEG